MEPQLSFPYLSEAERAQDRLLLLGDREIWESHQQAEAIEQEEDMSERLVCQMETFGEWLTEKLIDAPVIDLGYVPGQTATQSSKDRFFMRVEVMTVPMLMALALQGNEWAPLAMRTVRERYLGEMVR